MRMRGMRLHGPVAAASLAVLLACATASCALRSLGTGTCAAYAAAFAVQTTQYPEGPGPAQPSVADGAAPAAWPLAEFEGDVGAGVRAAALETLTRVPASAAERMADEGWRVVFTASRDLRDFTGALYGEEPLGVTVWAEKRIYVRATLGCAASTTLHEVAHWIDRDGGWLSSRTEWAEAYEAERGAYAEASEYAAGDAREMFAEVCDDVLLGRSANEGLAPRCAAIARRWLAEYGFEG